MRVRLQMQLQIFIASIVRDGFERSRNQFAFITAKGKTRLAGRESIARALTLLQQQFKHFNYSWEKAFLINQGKHLLCGSFTFHSSPNHHWPSFTANYSQLWPHLKKAFLDAFEYRTWRRSTGVSNIARQATLLCKRRISFRLRTLNWMLSKWEWENLQSASI